MSSSVRVRLSTREAERTLAAEVQRQLQGVESDHGLPAATAWAYAARVSDSPKLAPGQALLVATPATWREACLSVPAMRAIQRLGVRVKVICPDNQLSFWKATGFGEGVAYPTGASARAIASRLEEIERVLLWDAGPVAEACAKVGIPHRYGPAAGELAKRLTHPLPIVVEAGPIEHRVQFYLRIADALGAVAFVPENFVPTDPGVERGDTVLLAPDSDEGSHYEWPLERWVEIAGQLAKEGHPLTVAVQGRAGRALASQLGQAPAVELAFPALEELARHRLCITADGTLPHLAAHVGTTCVALFGPGEPEWLRPLGRRHATVRRKVECAPCFAPKCRMDLRCQDELETAAVLAAIGRTWAVTAPAVSA